MKSIKTLYLRIPSSYFRSRVKNTIISFIRKANIQKYLRKFGIVICQKQLQINSSILKTIAQNTNGLKIYQMCEENKINSAIYLPEQYLEGLEPFINKTRFYILDIANEKFSYRNNHLLDQNLNLIGELGINFEELPISSQLLPQPVSLNGTVAYLSDPDPSNYYHWMCRTLPLLRIYQKLFNLSKIDFFYIGQFSMKGFHQESFSKAGISMEKVIQDACTADRLVAAITERRICPFGDPISQEAYAFVRQLFYTEDFTKAIHRKRCIYVSRGNVNRRRVINEAEIVKHLEKYDFETVRMDNKTIQQQADLFSQADVIIAPHGAALTNLLFIQPGTKVIELIPHGYINSCFYVLASHAKATYSYLQGEKLSSSNNHARGLDLYIDIKKLEKICQLVLS